MEVEIVDEIFELEIKKTATEILIISKRDEMFFSVATKMKIRKDLVTNQFFGDQWET